MVVPGRHGLRRCRSVAGTSKNPPLSIRGLAACDNGIALIVGHVHVRAPADRCRRKLVTHVVLTVRCANVARSSRRRCGGPLRAAEAACLPGGGDGTRPPRLSAVLRIFSAMTCGGLPGSPCRRDDLAPLPRPTALPNCGKPSLWSSGKLSLVGVWHCWRCWRAAWRTPRRRRARCAGATRLISRTWMERGRHIRRRLIELQQAWRTGKVEI